MRQKKHGMPLWLICILLFAALVATTVHLIAPRSGSGAVVSAARPDPKATGVLKDASGSAPHGGASEETVGADGASEESSAPESVPPAPQSADEAVPVPEADERAGDEGTSEDGAPDASGSAALTAGSDAEEEAAPGPEVPSGAEDGATEAAHVHHYADGVCVECGAAPVFYTDFLPEEYYSEASHQGEVRLHEYRVTAWANWGEGEYDKCFNVYLPYGYDEQAQYDVLVLIHGGGGDQDSWLNTAYDYGSFQMRGRDIFDHIFEERVCKPCILVCPVMNTPELQGVEPGIFQMRDELREYILPYVAEHYATYAADGSLDSLRAAREHFALAGFSNGALFVFEGGMRYNFDLFGSYAAFSGNYEPWLTASAIRGEGWAELPIHCLFAGAGTDGDWQEEYTRIGFDYLVENDERLTEGKNAFRVDVAGGHEWKLCFTDICNALPLLFP